MASFWERQARRAGNVGSVIAAPATAGASLLGNSGARDFINNKFLGGDQKRASRNAAQIGADAETKSQGILKGIYDQSRADNAPFLQIGTDSANKLSGMLNNGQFDNPAFPTYNNGAPAPQAPGAFSYGAFDPSQIKNEPGYQFGLNQGLQSSQNSAAAGRGLHSGNTLTGLAKYAEDYAGTKLNDAFTRYTTGRNQALNEYNTGLSQYNTQLGQYNADRNFNYGQGVDRYYAGVTAQQNRFSRLAQIAGYGPAAASQNGNLGQNFGNSYSNSITNAANSHAAGLVGAANAGTQSFQNLLGLAGNIGGKVVGAA